MVYIHTLGSCYFIAANNFHMDTPREERNGKRLLLFPVPLQGHLNPMFQLANILYSKGFSITIIHTKFNSPNPSNYPHFTFFPISDGLTETEASTTDVIALLSLLNVICVDPFRDCLSKLTSDDDDDDEPIACLISDAIFHFTQAIADSFKLPRIVLRTSSLSSFLAFAAFPLLRQKGYFPLQDSKLDDLVPELPPLRVKDIPAINTQNPEKLYDLVAGMINESKASSGLIWNSFEELEKTALTTIRQDFPIPIFSIGPFHKYFQSCQSSLLAQDQTSITWLDSQAAKSVIYASFGSIATIDASQFLEIGFGLANSKQPFLWVVRPGLVRGFEWLESLPNGYLEMIKGRGHIVKWAPQQEVLAHPSVGAFWTHNGWNSTLESLCEGVPMICLPSFGDQMVNARYVSHVWRVGVQLNNGLEREEIERAIRGLMVEKEGEDGIRDRIAHLKEKANLCLRKGGSSNQSLQSLINYILSF